MVKFMEHIPIRNRLIISLRNFIHTLLKLIPKQKNLVLCNAWFGQKYIDNPMYMYEYLLNQREYKVCWLTKNSEVYEKLKKEGKPVVMMNSLSGIIKQIRAQAVFSTVQFSDYNQWLLTNTIYIDLGHGHPIKNPGKHLTQEPMLSIQESLLKNLYYYGIKASKFAKEKYKDVVAVADEHIYISDFARNDVFIDESLRNGKNRIVDKVKKERKAIIYMPTHRSDGKKKIQINDILPLVDIDNFCEKNNFVFIIKKHFYHRNEKEDLSQFRHIYDLTQEDLDPQVLLYQADILISDYSACYIDYLLLNRPIMFYHYDIKYFEANERSIYLPFAKLDFAPKANDKSEFIEKMERAINNDGYYKAKRETFTPQYFDNQYQCNGRHKVKLILDELMKKHYPKN